MLSSSRALRETNKIDKNNDKVKGSEPSKRNAIKLDLSSKKRKECEKEINHISVCNAKRKVAKRDNSNVNNEHNRVHRVFTQSISTTSVPNEIDNHTPIVKDILKLHSIQVRDTISFSDTVQAQDDGVRNFMRKFQKRWISINPGVPSVPT